MSHVIFVQIEHIQYFLDFTYIRPADLNSNLNRWPTSSLLAVTCGAIMATATDFDALAVDPRLLQGKQFLRECKFEEAVAMFASLLESR